LCACCCVALCSHNNSIQQFRCSFIVVLQGRSVGLRCSKVSTAKILINNNEFRVDLFCAIELPDDERTATRDVSGQVQPKLHLRHLRLEQNKILFNCINCITGKSKTTRFPIPFQSVRIVQFPSCLKELNSE
jgi:hypothetical protein